ncbi:MAG: DUF2760 domain-containing protein [Desulfobacterales bacterium]|nr:DUF2760 domain-containing protein [Desulfobacterales bacterium]
MNATKAYATKSFTVIMLFMLIIGGAVSAGILFGLKKLALVFAPGADGIITVPGTHETFTVQTPADLVHFIETATTQYAAHISIFTVLVFFVLSLILWVLLKSSVGSLFKGLASEPAGKKDSGSDYGPKKKDFVEKKLEQERQKRLFLHFISVLQREGRLIDFFAEDLSLYDDDQIGAAVRSIQEDCKKSVDKYLSLGPVIDKQEGDDVEVEPGFDPNAITLTGNVSGEPPFKGVLRHRGWKAAKNEVPKLSDVQDASIVAPAEVEVE